LYIMNYSRRKVGKGRLIQALVLALALGLLPVLPPQLLGVAHGAVQSEIWVMPSVSTPRVIQGDWETTNQTSEARFGWIYPANAKPNIISHARLL
jgi:hypothetical protein